MDYSGELQAALKAADEASELIRRHYAGRTAEASAAADVTTQTDRATQELVLQRLSAEFPDDGFRAEEVTPTLDRLPRQGDRLWVIDPIDGTRGFVLKNGEFSVMIALVVGGQPVVGVVAEPAHRRVTFAAAGGGCFQLTEGGEPRPVRASEKHELADATLITSHLKADRGPPPEVRCVGPRQVVETYSAGVKLARVADGSADLYVCTYAAMNDWDIAAGAALTAEAGGRLTRLDGTPLTYGGPSPVQSGGLLATNGRLHAAAVAALSQLKAAAVT